MEMLVGGILLAAFIAASAFFAAAEVSFLSLSPVRLHSLVEKRREGADSVVRLKKERRHVVISLLIGNNVVNIAASAIATDMAIVLFGDSGLGIAVGVMSFLLLTFGDIAPKSFATSNGERFMLFFGRLIWIYYRLSYPLVMVFDAINRLIPGVYSRATIVEQFTEAEVRSAVRLGALHKGITEKEREMIENVLEFNDRTVAEVMTNRIDVVSLRGDVTVVQAHKAAIGSQYFRFPVVDHEGRIIGLVNLKTLGRCLYEHPGWKVSKVALIPVLVEKGDKISNAFSKLQSSGRSIALIPDKEGKLEGIVTMEDLLEELVGELK
ncbi:MAG: CNNM domain-containing protein [Candidatus Micrarchaeota archaeon]